MSTVSLTQWLAVVCAVGAVWSMKGIVARRKRNPRRLPLPPGPKGLPIIGNLMQLPLEGAWEVYKTMCEENGSGMVYLEALGQPILVLGTSEHAVELLDKRSVNYSDRPVLPMVNMMDMGWSFAFMRYGPEWRQHRRTFHHYLNVHAIENYYPIIYEEINIVLRKLKEDPKGFLGHIQVLFGASIMRTAYGFDDIARNQRLIDSAELLVEGFSDASTPGRFLVNVFPILRHIPAWMPGAHFRRRFSELARMSQDLLRSPFEDAKADYSGNEQPKIAHPSMASSLIEELAGQSGSDRGQMEEVAMNVCAQAYLAGADTTVSSATVLILALANHPEVQKKAQEEIDTVVGPDRLPTMQDRNALPYVHAIVKEISRWYTVVPVGVPHVSTEDDVYNGHFIPKGTYVLTNSWAIMHDPEVFERPFDFNPDRYLKDGAIDPSVPDPETAAFGFGRRICPGRFFSNDAIFLFAASLLSSFDCRPPKDDAGNHPSLKLELVGHTVAKPAPFECDITPRLSRESLLQH